MIFQTSSPNIWVLERDSNLPSSVNFNRVDLGCRSTPSTDIFSRDRNGYGGQSARLQRNQGGHGQHRNSERGHQGGQGPMGRGRSQNSLAKSSSGSSMGARHHQRPNSIGRDEFDDGGENQFVTNYEAEMSALKPRETFTLSPIKKDPEMSYVEPVVNQGKLQIQLATAMVVTDVANLQTDTIIKLPKSWCHQHHFWVAHAKLYLLFFYKYFFRTSNYSRYAHK